MKNDKDIILQLELKSPIMVGVGVFGRVYKAFDKNGKLVCVKLIPSEKFKEEEWRASEKLKNKNDDNVIICSIMKKFEEAKLVALVMDYMDGGDLKSYIDNYSGYLSEKQIYDIIKQICL
jgi:serine/threonine protein kinase